MALPYQLQKTGQEIDDLLQKIDDLGPASSESAGTMSAEDKEKLDDIESSAERNVIEGIVLGETSLTPSASKTVTIPVDSEPAEGSENPVASGGVYDALGGKMDKDTSAGEGDIAVFNDEGQVVGAFDVNEVVREGRIKQTTGQSTTDLMSQKAVTDELDAKAAKDDDAVEGNLAKFDSNGNPVDAGIAAEKVAQIDGYYGSLTAGTAENLVGRGTTEAEYVNRRTSAGTADIGSGSAAITRIKGRSVVWNQLVRNGNFANGTTLWTVALGTVTDGVFTSTPLEASPSGTKLILVSALGRFQPGHKIYNFCLYNSTHEMRLGSNGVLGSSVDFPATSTFTPASYIGTVANTNQLQLSVGFAANTPIGATFSVKSAVAIDLTLLGIDNLTTVAEVEAWLAENIGPLDYYAYNPGEVINNAANGIKTRGFNLFNYETGKAYLPGKYSDYPYEYEICGTFTSISFTDVNGNTSVPELHDGRFFNVDAPGELTVVGGNNTDTLVHLVWSGWRNYGEPDYVYEPYWENTLNLGLTSLTGKLNGQGSSVVVFPHGLAKVGDVQDEIVGNRAIKRVGVVDMGTLDWSKYSDGKFYIQLTDMKVSTINLLCSKYIATANPVGSSAKNGYISCGVNLNYIYVHDDSYTDAAAFKDAMNGVLLYYELATPEEYILDNPPQYNYRVDDFSTEETVPSYDPANVIAPLAYDVQYAMNAVDAIRRLPDNYVERKDVKQVPGDSDKFVLSQKAVNDNYAKKVGVEDNLTVGLAKNIEGNATSGGYPFTFVKISGTDGLAKINDVRGKSQVWNQLCTKKTGPYAYNGVTFTYNNDGTVTANGTAVGGNGVTPSYIAPGNLVQGHKYYVRGCPDGGSDSTYRLRFTSGSVSEFGGGKIFTAGPSVGGLTLQVMEGYTATNLVFKAPTLIDLTLMFGAGNEPSTVAEVEALFPMPYYAYNSGEIISNKTEQVKVVGFNQWDEEWEAGSINTTTGENEANNTRIRSKNYCPCLPNTDYNKTAPTLGNIVLYFYDAAKKYISWHSTAQASVTTPNGAYYFKLVLISATTYNHDICINLSDASRNGTYEPYKTNTIELNLPTLTGKVNGEGESVVIASDGLKSAGSVYDDGIVENGYITKIVKRIGVVDMGTLNWTYRTEGTDAPFFYAFISTLPSNVTYFNNILCSKYTYSRGFANADKAINGTAYVTWKEINVKDSAYTDAATFKTAMSGVMLNYELAEPVTYVLDTPIPATFQSYKDGTLKQIPENGSVPTTAPHAMSVTYAIDAAGILTGLPQNYISKESLQAMLTDMQSAGLFSSYTMTFNSSTGKYEFTFTPNA